MSDTATPVKVNTTTLDNSDQLTLKRSDGYTTIGTTESKEDINLVEKENFENKINEIYTYYKDIIWNKLDPSLVHKYDEFTSTPPDENIYGPKNFYGSNTFYNYVTLAKDGYLDVDSKADFSNNVKFSNNVNFSEIPTTKTPSYDSDDYSMPNTEWVNNLVSNTNNDLTSYIDEKIQNLDSTVVHKTGEETIDGTKTFTQTIFFNENPKTTIAPSDNSNDYSIPNTAWVQNTFKNLLNKNNKINWYAKLELYNKKTNTNYSNENGFGNFVFISGGDRYDEWDYELWDKVYSKENQTNSTKLETLKKLIEFKKSAYTAPCDGWLIIRDDFDSLTNEGWKIAIYKNDVEEEIESFSEDNLPSNDIVYENYVTETLRGVVDIETNGGIATRTFYTLKLCKGDKIKGFVTHKKVIDRINFYANDKVNNTLE